MAFGIVRKDKAQIDVEINGSSVKRSIADIQKDYRRLNREIQQLAVGSKEFNEKAKELGKVKEELGKARTAANNFGKSQGLLARGFGVIGGAIKSAMASLLPLLAFSEAFNLAREMFNAAKATEELTAKINTLTGATGDELDQLVISAKALDKTFEDAEIDSVLSAATAAANAFNKEGEEMGKTYQDTLNNIELGLLAVVDGKGDEFLEQVKEYSVQLEQLGLSQSQSFALIARGINEGVFNDKAPDAIKELGLRLGDLTKAQKDVLAQNFGKEFADNVDSGKIKTIDALGQISTGLNQMQEKGEKITPVISNLFGGAGEDAGEKFILSLSAVDQELNDLVDTSNVYVRQQLERLEANRQLAAAEQDLSFALRGSGNALTVIWAKIQTLVINRIAQIIEAIRYFPEYFRATTSSFKNFGNALLIYVNRVIESINTLLTPFRAVLQAVFDVDFKIPQFKIDDTNNPYKEVEEKIQKDREAFALEQQRKQAAETEKQAAFQREQEVKAQAARAKALREQKAKDAEKQAKEIAEAERAIQRLQIELMEEGVEKQIALANFSTNEKIRNLKGSAEQIMTQTRLLEEQLTDTIISIRSKASIEETTELRKNAEERIKALTGSEKFVAEQIKLINKELLTSIEENITQDQETQINILQTATDKRIEALTGSEEFVKNETIRLRQELTQEVIKIQSESADQLTAQRKLIAESELSEKEKAYKEQIELIKKAREEEELLATQTTVQDIQTGEDPVIAEQALKQELLQIELDFLNRKLELQEIFGQDTTALKKEIADQEIQIAQDRIKTEADIEQQAQDQKKQIKQAAVSAIKDIVDFQAQQVQFGLNQELAALEQKKEKELASVGNNEKKKQAIEASFQRQKEAAEKEAAEKQKNIAIVQTIINVAESIVKTGSQLGYPFAIPFQAIAAAIGFKQIQNIRQQSFAEGGPTGLAPLFVAPDRTGEKPVGVVHEREWVGPRWMYESPVYRPYFDFLEASRLRGYAEGGPTSTTPSDLAVQIPQQDNTNEALREEIRGLKDSLRSMQFVMAIDQRTADLVQEEQNDLNTQRSRTQLG